MGLNNKMTQAEIKRAKEMRATGMSFPEIGKALGRHHATIYRALNPKAARQHKESQSKRNFRKSLSYSERYGDPSGHIVVSKSQARVMAEKLMDQIPQDTRDLTARICGDPLPQRSALAMKRGGET